MAPPQTSDAFLEVVRKSGLVPRGRIALSTARESPSSATEMARTLIAQGDITTFQAARLLEGAFRGFFIEQYKVLDIVGGGGMGLLYLAEHRETREKVALKVLAEVYKHDTAMRARFELEARAAMQVDHPNIVRMFELGYTDDLYDKVPFMAMEFVKGLELQELAAQKQGPIDWPQACDLIRQVAAGLHHAHESGLVHRDVKPTNLLIDEAGNAKLLDFGLALMQHGDQDNELSLVLIFGQGCVGTDDFISPEQTYNSSAVDRRADIYSLGCTFYFALTGRVPFPVGPSTKKIEAHRKQEPRPLRELIPRLPEGLAAIVQKMMAKEPDDRFQTAAEIERALLPYSKRQPVKFDFCVLLAARRKVIKQRAIAQRSRFAHPSTVTRSGTNRSDQKSVSSEETIVNKDTQREHPAPYSEPQGTGPSASSSRTTRRNSSIPAAISHPSEQVPQAYLIPADGGRIVLRKTRISIGRAPDCDVRLPSPGIAAKHCELYFNGTDWNIYSVERDCNLLVNGSRSSESTLRSGDKLTIAGQYHFRFEIAGGTPRWRGGVRFRWITAAVAVAALLLGCCWWLL